MNVITADTATKESVEAALDAAFKTVFPNAEIRTGEPDLLGEIASELPSFLQHREMSLSHFLGSRSKTAIYARRAFVLDMIACGYSMVEISCATRIPYSTISNIKRKFCK
jgi:DNA-binding NarL/FixJ family response regulator